MDMEFLNPSKWKRPRGYSNGVAARGTVVFVAGQIGWNGEEVFESDDFGDQVRQALRNTVEVLAEVGAAPSHIARMTWYVSDKEEYQRSLRAVGQAYRDVIGEHYPAMTLVEVASLLEPRAKVEIESTAVIPDPA